MSVMYRVQKQNGLGPYAGNGCDAGNYLMSSLDHARELRPVPEFDDGLDFDIPDDRHYFGFDTLSQLLKWFPLKALRHLYSIEYAVYIVPVDGIQTSTFQAVGINLDQENAVKLALTFIIAGAEPHELTTDEQKEKREPPTIPIMPMEDPYRRTSRKGSEWIDKGTKQEWLRMMYSSGSIPANFAGEWKEKLIAEIMETVEPKSRQPTGD